VIPRWEWRTFGGQFGEGEKKLEQFDCTRVIETSEIYILPTIDGVNCKIRNQTLDIKLLRMVNGDKLEQWEPVFKVSFPLSASDVREVFAALKLPEPNDPARQTEPTCPTGRDYRYEAFIEELIVPVESLQMVSVTKKRRGYRMSGAILEMTDLLVDGKKTRTVCVEHHDPDLVLEIVRDLGFDTYENINYIRAIRGIVCGEDS